MNLTDKDISLVFKAFCDENRIKILKLLMNGEMCACKILDAMDFTQPTLSHHMKILCDSGVVVGRKEGKWVHYSISLEGMEHAITFLESLMDKSCIATKEVSCCKD